MSTVNPYNSPADFSYGVWEHKPLLMTTPDTSCRKCGSRHLDGGSFVAGDSGWAWQCKPCTTKQMDEYELTQFINRLERNPELAARVRKALGVE